MASANLENSAQVIHADQNLIAGRYRTHSRIGRGRLGEIFAASDAGIEQPGVEPHLAVQTIPESVVRNNKLFNKLNLGYSKLRAAAHPNIVGIVDFGRDGRSGYLVMDLLDGLSLRSVLDKAGALSADEAKPVIRGVGEALHLLHANDMVHGNLTTSSVFITHELDVRLLDVLPLDSAETILRDTANGEPFKSCSVEDDVFDLACLAYEMLAGTPPFNGTPPAKARLVGIEALRPGSLTDGEWSALRRALSSDREQRTTSIMEFVRDFGISDAERLLPTEAEAQPLMQSTSATQSAATAPPAAIANPFPLDEDWLQKAEPIRKRARPLRAVLLSVLLAMLGAWSYYGQPRDNIAELISYVEENTSVGLAAGYDATIETSTTEPATSTAAIDDAMIEEIVVTSVQPSVQLVSAAIQQAGPELDFIRSIVSVSERDGAVRIEPPLIESSATPMIWWTNEHTAKAGKDFIPVEQQPLADASVGDDTVLYVSLVNDDLPEPAESFFVSFGVRNPQQGQVERIATVRVDIVDDELP